MVPNTHPTMSLLPRGALLFLLLLNCMVISSLADSLPSFVKSPEDQTGISGRAASFVCQAAGEPKPRITWTKKGKIFTSQRFETVEFDDGSGSVLRIQPLRLNRDEATFECTANNSVGEIKTSAKLTVLNENQIPHGFPTIDMGPQLKVVERTRTATMLCAASGNPDPEISWFKDGLPVDISSNGRLKQLRSGALQIDNSEESDQGKYECVAMNSVGTRYSAPANLYVRVRRVPPRFDILPTDQEVMLGGSVNLTCVAVGSPMPYIKWMMGSEDLTEEDEMPMGRNVLEVTNIRESANYTCLAISSLGVMEATAQVTVKALSVPPQEVHLVSLSSTSLRVSWVAPPDASRHGAIVRYTVSYQALAGEDTERHEVTGISADATSYVLEGLEKWTEYQVWVRAHTDVGPGPESAPVRMRTKEDVPGAHHRKLEVESINLTAIRVTWKPPLQGKQHSQI